MYSSTNIVFRAPEKVGLQSDEAALQNKKLTEVAE